MSCTIRITQFVGEQPIRQFTIYENNGELPDTAVEKYPDRDWITTQHEESLRDPGDRIICQYLTYPKTKKTYICKHCEKIIERGTHSVSRSTEFDDGVWVYDRFHNECLKDGFDKRPIKPVRTEPNFLL